MFFLSADSRWQHFKLHCVKLFFLLLGDIFVNETNGKIVGVDYDNAQIS